MSKRVERDSAYNLIKNVSVYKSNRVVSCRMMSERDGLCRMMSDIVRYGRFVSFICRIMPKHRHKLKRS